MTEPKAEDSSGQAKRESEKAGRSRGPSTQERGRSRTTSEPLDPIGALDIPIEIGGLHTRVKLPKQ